MATDAADANATRHLGDVVIFFTLLLRSSRLQSGPGGCASAVIKI
jgi:hypothetical protein